MNPFILTSSREIYKNPWIQVREDSVIRPGGKEGIFGVVTMKDGCTIIALDENKNIFVTHEYHYAVDSETTELISGGIDGDEDILTCAKRELEEEIGYQATEWKYLGYIDPFTTVVQSKNHLFLAKNLKPTEAHPDEGEVIRVSKVPYQKALEMVMNSEITHGASVVAILKAQKYI